MVAADDDRGGDFAGADHFVEGEAQAVALAEPDPADPRGEALEGDPLARHVEPAVEMGIVGDQFLHALVGLVDVLGIAAQRDPAERADTATEEWADIGRDETGEVERVGDAGVERFLADVVAIIEGGHAHFLEGEHRFDMDGHRLARGGDDGLRVFLAHLLPFGDGPAGGAVTVGGIVGAGLVGHRIGTNAECDHFRKHVRRIAEQADRRRFGRLGDDVERLVDAGRAMIEVAGGEALLDRAFLHFDRDAMRPGHHRRERLRPAHPAEAGGEDPLARQVAAIMLAAHFGEGLEGALNDALGADVDPRPGSHLPVHHQPETIEFVKLFPGRPFGDEVGVGDENARGVGVGLEHPDRFSRLDQQGLVLLQPLERFDDLVVTFPIARGATDPAVDDQALRIFGDLIIEVVHQHPHRRLGGPMLRLDLGAATSADLAAVVSPLVGHANISAHQHRISPTNDTPNTIVRTLGTPAA